MARTKKGAGKSEPTDSGPSGFTMDDIARRFLNTPPSPKTAKKTPTARAPKEPKAKAPPKGPRGG